VAEGTVAVGVLVALALGCTVSAGGAVGLLADDWKGLAHPTSNPDKSTKAKIRAIFKGAPDKRRIFTTEFLTTEVTEEEEKKLYRKISAVTARNEAVSLPRGDCFTDPEEHRVFSQ